MSKIKADFKLLDNFGIISEHLMPIKTILQNHFGTPVPLSQIALLNP